SGNGCANRGGTQNGSLRVEVDRVPRVRQALVETGAPALNLILARQCFQLLRVAAKQHRVRQNTAPIAQLNPSLPANGDDGAFQMLIGTHAPGDSIHNDADSVHGLNLYLSASCANIV